MIKNITEKWNIVCDTYRISENKNVVNFELSCELMKKRGILIPFERLNSKHSDHALLFLVFFFMGDNFFSSSWRHKVLAIKLEDKPLCETSSCLSCCARWFWLASLWITPNVWSYRAVLCYGAVILLCKVVLVAHNTLRFDRYFSVTSDNIRIQRLVHQIKSFISGRRMSNQLKYWWETLF